ncbi:MAG: hypothetical protein EXR21_02660 [Flavobacteriaceae bacterium]|nr:hypothetical protein [Flavobacteriaceae bacterium]
MLILSLIMPKSGVVNRTVLIKAPKGTVWALVKDLKMHERWSPWKEHDTNMTNTFSGPDGEIGQKYEWKGNDEVGEGSQEITKMEAEALQVVHLHFMKPWENETDATFTLRDTTDAAVAVTWGMEWTMPWPMNAMGAFMNMDKMVGSDFEKGLNKLKVLAESAPAAASFEIKVIEMPTRTYWGKQGMVDKVKIGDYLGENLPKIFGDIMKTKAQPEGAPCGIFFKWDDASPQTDMAAAVPAKGFKSSTWKSWEVKAGKAASIEYYGDYNGTEAAHNALSKHIADNKLEMNGPVIEEYITDPMAEKDTAKWLTKIYYPVK